MAKQQRQWGLTKELDTKKRSSTSSHFEDALRKRIAGQDEAVQALVELYQTFCVGLNSPARPVGNLLFPRADRLRQDAHCRGRCRDSVRR